MSSAPLARSNSSAAAYILAFSERLAPRVERDSQSPDGMWAELAPDGALVCERHASITMTPSPFFCACL
jgi:hypothetical protein